MGSVHNDLHSWALRARKQGQSTIEIDLETADRAAEKIVELSNRVMDLEHALRTSEPEAGAVARQWRAVDEQGPRTSWRELDWRSEREAREWEASHSVEYRDLFDHPAPATADKLREAVDLLNDCIWLDTDTGDYRVENDGSVEKARAILAALNEGGEV